MRKRVSLALAALLLLVLAPAASARKAATACDPFATRACLMPFPNDMNLTVQDQKSPTGLRLKLPPRRCPRTRPASGSRSRDYNRHDGFSPGQTIVVKVKGLQTQKAFDRSKLVPLEDLGQSFAAKRAGVVVINARTHKRQLIYAELDANAKKTSERMLLIHPAKNFDEGARYIVALRNLRPRRARRSSRARASARSRTARARSACARATRASSRRSSAPASRRAR